MKEQHEQTGSGFGRLVLHWRPSREMRIRARSDDLTVGLQLTFQYNDRVRSRMAVDATSHASRVADEVVFFAACGILEEEPELDGPVVDGRGRRAGLTQLQRLEIVDDGRGMVGHALIQAVAGP